MEITIFPSDKGDCLLLTGQDGRRMLIDGGMQRSYRGHVAPALGALQAAGKGIDVVYVSHIDEDHIAGVLQLADDLLAWKIFDHMRSEGDADFLEPGKCRPPSVQEVWHNGFDEQIGANAGDVADLLVQMATTLSGHPDGSMRLIASEQHNLATSEKQAVMLQRRLGKKQLGIPLNGPSDGALMMVREDNKPIAVGGMLVHIVAPFAEDLENLRDQWVKWLRSAKGKKQLIEVRSDAKKKEDLLRSSELDLFMSMLEAEATALGDRKDVTPPNLASLMLLVDEGERSVLLTGDGHADDVIKGLRQLKRIPSRARTARGLHVDVCKIPHHGAVANMTEEFAKLVTANHYVFCGNGEHDNPEEQVVSLIIDSRLGPAGTRSRNPQVDQPFKLWFSCSSDFEGLSIANVQHMGAIERLVDDRANQSEGKLTFEFLKQKPLVFRAGPA